MARHTKAGILTLGQHITVASSRMILGALTGVLRMTRGFQPEGWKTVRYGTHRDETLDFLYADPKVKKRAPVVFFHGGGWMMGTTDTYSHDLLFLAEAGHDIFNVEYPKAPEDPHPIILRAVFKALAFIRDHYPDTKAVHLVGDSAGGNLAVMAGLLIQNPELMAPIGTAFKPRDLPKVLSVTSIYGVLDRKTCLNGSVPAGDTMLISYAGPGALAKVVDADHAITPMDVTFTKHPPCLLACGDADPLLASQKIYEERLKDEGHTVMAKVYPSAIHAFLNFPESAAKANLRKDILAFLSGVENA